MIYTNIETATANAAHMAALGELGAPALANFRAKFRPDGLLKVVRHARAAKGATMYPDLSARRTRLEAELAKIPNGDSRRFGIAVQIADVDRHLAPASSDCMAVGAAAFRDPASLRLLRDDLRRLVAELVSALDDIVAKHRTFYLANNWGDCDQAALAVSCPPFVAMQSFLETHVRPLADAFEVQCNPDCAGVSVPDPTASSWILASCGWDTIKIT